MITHFTGENRWLSNFGEESVVYEGTVYPTSEHAFQAAKTLDVEERLKIKACKTPGKAKKLGRKVTLRSDWEEVKIDIMEEIVTAKFMQNSNIAKKLLDTGSQYLIEGNTWGDKFWGCVYENNKWVGHNHLGTILMKIRKKLNENLNR